MKKYFALVLANTVNIYAIKCRSEMRFSKIVLNVWMLIVVITEVRGNFYSPICIRSKLTKIVFVFVCKLDEHNNNTMYLNGQRLNTESNIHASTSFYKLSMKSTIILFACHLWTFLKAIIINTYMRSMVCIYMCHAFQYSAARTQGWAYQ